MDSASDTIICMSTRRRVTHIKPRDTPLENDFSKVLAVEERLRPAHHFPPRKLHYLTFELTRAGAAVTHSGNDQFQLKSGSLIIMPSGIRFETRVDPDHEWDTCYLMIKGRWANMIEHKILGGQSKLFHHAQAPTMLRNSLQHAVALALNQPPDWHWAFLQNFCQMTNLLSQTTPTINTTRNSIASIRKLVHLSPNREWSVPELAAEMNISPSTLWHGFKSTTGHTPAAIVRRERMVIARRLLEQGLSVVQVADYLGYSSPYSFSRSFKTETGFPPSHIKSISVPK